MADFDNLIDALDDLVRDIPRTNGERLVDEDQVDILDARPGILRAAVDTQRYRYRVKLDWDEVGFDYQCSCGVDEEFVCEHIWASVLAASEEGYYDGARPQAGKSQYLEKVAQVVARASAAPPAPPKPRWKKVLKKIAGTPHPRPAAWPAEREIIYVIDLAQVKDASGIPLEVSYRERKKDGAWSKPKGARVSRDQIDSLPDGADRTILAMLTGAQSGDYGYG